MTPHLACPIHEVSQIGDARRQAARLGSALDFNELAQGRLALVVTEMATNLVRHAQEGLLLIGPYGQAAVATIEVIAVDRGPGMRDIEHSLSDGVSTGGTAGTGLGAVRRLASQFIIASKRAWGTVVVARLTADNSTLPASHAEPAAFSYAGLCVAAPGETVSGDSWAGHGNEQRASFMVADGLGHGPDAAQAADAAVDVFRARPGAAPDEVLERCHAALRSTRGAAVSVFDIDAATRTVTACGAGNVSARIISGIGDRSLLSQHGTAGLQIRKIQPMRYELPEHALFVAHSDGIVSRWDLKAVPELLGSDPVVLAAFLIRNHLRGRDDATVLVVRCH